MNILIFGTANTTCQRLIKQALEQGHYVSVFLSPLAQPALFPNDNLDIIAGDILNYTAVDEAMQGQGVVIDALDTNVFLPASFFSDSAANIIKAMQVNKVKQIVVLSKIGVNGSFEQGPWLYRLWMLLIKNATSQIMRNMALHEERIKNSGLHFTIVRTVAVTNKQTKRNTLDVSRQTKIKLKKSFIATAILADFVLSVITEKLYLNEIIGVSGK